jgi:hypothetical protein
MCNLQSARIADIGEKRFEVVIAKSCLLHSQYSYDINVSIYVNMPENIIRQAYYNNITI